MRVPDSHEADLEIAAALLVGLLGHGHDLGELIAFSYSAAGELLRLRCSFTITRGPIGLA